MICPKCHHTNAPAQVLCEQCRQTLRHARLRVIEQNGAERYFELNERDFTVGRQPENDLALADEAASRCHARLHMVAGAYVVEDLQSKNGLFVNGAKVQSRRLVSLDCLQIGVTRIYYVMCEAPYSLAFVNASSSSTSKTLTALRGGTAKAQGLKEEYLLEQVLHLLLRGALQLAHAERATIWIPDATGDLIPRWCARDEQTMPNACDDDIAKQQHLALNIFHSGVAILREQQERTETFWEALETNAVLAYQQLGFALRPTVGEQSATNAFASAAPLGALILECPSGPQRLSPTQRARLQNFIKEAAKFVQDAQCVAAALRRDAREAEIADEIQRRLLQVTIPRIDGFDTACWHRPAGAVSGDYLDLLPLHNDELLLAVGDVSGKGLAAALALFAMQACLHLQLHYETKLEKILGELNRLLHAVSAASTFTTLFLGMLNPQRRTLRYVNAGHTPGLFVLSSDTAPTVEFLHSNCAALGVMEELSVEAKQVFLPPASALVLFTDGLTEAVNDSGEQYGLTRLTERTVGAMMSSRQTGAAQVLETLRADLVLYSADFHDKVIRFDDQAALVIMAR